MDTLTIGKTCTKQPLFDVLVWDIKQWKTLHSSAASKLFQYFSNGEASKVCFDYGCKVDWKNNIFEKTEINICTNFHPNNFDTSYFCLIILFLIDCAVFKGSMIGFVYNFPTEFLSNPHNHKNQQKILTLTISVFSNFF